MAFTLALSVAQAFVFVHLGSAPRVRGGSHVGAS
jgi:hypothetical protein